TGGAATGTNPSDTLVGIVNATVSGTSDTLVGGSGNGTLSAHGTGDTLIGGSGTTTLIGTVSSNTLTKGSGLAIASYTGFNGLSVNLQAGQASVGGSHDTLHGITDAVVSGNNDTLTAAGNDTLEFLSGSNDTFVSSPAGNTLIDLAGAS